MMKIGNREPEAIFRSRWFFFCPKREMFKKEKYANPLQALRGYRCGMVRE